MGFKIWFHGLIIEVTKYTLAIIMYLGPEVATIRGGLIKELGAWLLSEFLSFLHVLCFALTDEQTLV